MRWDALFADLEAAAAGEWQRERDAEIAERTRAELARLRLVDRLRAVADGRPGLDVELGVRVVSAGVVRGSLTRVTDEWFVLVTPSHEWVVATDAVLGVTGLPPAARSPESQGTVARAWGWSAAWRVLARDRTEVHVIRRDGSTVTGLASRAGQDFVELTASERLADPVRSGTTSELVPHAAIAAVRCPREPADPRR
jgi:hypothetical protein